MNKKFQFHKGAIRTSDSKDNLDSDSNFNSIKVRLEPTPHFLGVTFSAFQFHKGAIRTFLHQG